MVASAEGLGPEKHCAGKLAAHSEDRSALSSERIPNEKKTVTLKE
jgi:hypothetical protein